MISPEIIAAADRVLPAPKNTANWAISFRLQVMTKGERTRLLGSGRLCYVLVAVGSLDGLCLNCFGSIGLRDLPFMFEDQWIMLDPYFLFSIGTCHILHGRGP